MSSEDIVRSARELDRRRLIAAGLACGVPLLSSFDTALALASGWRPQAGVERRACVGLALVACAAFVGLATRRGRAALSRRWVPIGFGTGLTLGGLLVFELFTPRQAPFHLRTPGLRTTLDPGRSIPGVTGLGRFSANSVGIRGEELPSSDDAYKILCVGGSTTESLYLDDTEAWPHLVQQLLPGRWGRDVWVGNAGMSGYASAEHLAFLEGLDVLSQMDCVVMLVGFNDFNMVTLGGRRPIAPWKSPLWARCGLIRLLKGLQRRWEGDPQELTPRGGFFEVRRELRRTSPKVDCLPDLTPELAAYEARLVEIARLCGRRGVRLVFITQPTLWRAELDDAALGLLWAGWTRDRARYYAVPGLEEGMARFNERLAEVARRERVELIDLAEISGQPRWFYDDCHYTEEGSRVVALTVASRLAPPRDALQHAQHQSTPRHPGSRRVATQPQGVRDDRDRAQAQDPEQKVEGASAR